MFACGRYEGIDQRVVDDAAARMPVDEVSIGDYVLVGGEVAVLVMVEAVVRLLPGVLGNPRSAQQDSFSDGLLEGPAYTRPESWRGLAVPDVLRSGNHAAIARWRRDRALERTAGPAARPARRAARRRARRAPTGRSSRRCASAGDTCVPGPSASGTMDGCQRPTRATVCGPLARVPSPAAAAVPDPRP